MHYLPPHRNYLQVLPRALPCLIACAHSSLKMSFRGCATLRLRRLALLKPLAEHTLLPYMHRDTLTHTHTHHTHTHIPSHCPFQRMGTLPRRPQTAVHSVVRVPQCVSSFLFFKSASVTPHRPSLLMESISVHAPQG